MSKKKDHWSDQPCPACKKPVSVDANVCPYCQHEFSDKEKADRKNTKLAAVGCAILLIMGIIGGVTMCSNDDSGPIEAGSAENNSSAPDELEFDEEALRAELNKSIPPTPAPSSAPDIPHSGVCVTETCAVYRITFEDRDWPGAWMGDYQAQRNVAFCLRDGCGGAVMPDLTTACAWRSVILEMHPDKITDSDGESLQNVCGMLSEGQALAAVQKAKSIYSRIE